MFSISRFPGCLYRQLQGKSKSELNYFSFDAERGLVQESEESTYHLPDEMSFVVDKMIDYLYTGDYSDPTDKGPEDGNPKEQWDTMSSLQLHAKLFALGDKYDIPELCDLTLEKYSKRAGEDNPSEYLDSLADVFFSPTIQNTALKEAAVRIPRGYLGVRLQYESVRMKYDSVITQVPEYANQLLLTFWELPYMHYCKLCEPNTPLWPTGGTCRKCRTYYKISRPRPAKQ